MKKPTRLFLCLLLCFLLLSSPFAHAAPVDGVSYTAFESNASNMLDYLGPALAAGEKTVAFEKTTEADGVVKLLFLRGNAEMVGFTFPHSELIDAIFYKPKAGTQDDTFYTFGFLSGTLSEKSFGSTFDRLSINLLGAENEMAHGVPFGAYQRDRYTTYIWTDAQNPQQAYFLHQHEDSQLLGELFFQRFGIVHPTALLNAAPSPTPAPTPAAQAPIAAPASYDFSALSDEELLAFWNQVGEVLRDRGAYPSVELARGDQGIDVIRLQRRLADLYYFTGDFTGKYDDATVKAVKAFEKTNGIKGDGKMSIDEQALLYSEAAAAKATPTPRPTPTPLLDKDVLQLKKATLFSKYGYNRFRVEVKNVSSEYAIAAFDLVARAYDRNGNALGWYKGEEEKGFAEQECKIEPKGTYKMSGDYWDLFGWDKAAKLEVAIAGYRTTDGKTVVILPEDLIWVESNSK